LSTAAVVVLADEAATQHLGVRIATALDQKGWRIGLSGPLGAGKSTLARAILRGLGVSGAVPSPTYTLIEPYTTSLGEAYHVDLYRISRASELLALGLPELVADAALMLVEWPERDIAGVLDFDFILELDHVALARELQVRPRSKAGRRLCRAINWVGA